MKRNSMLLAIVGAMLALVAPASAMAKVTIVPAGHNFEISGSSPVIQGSLTGSCSITKITGTIPAAPGNEGEVVDSKLAAPTVSCGAGVTATVGGGEWKLRSTQGVYLTFVTVPANGLTLRYTSLPGCKLTNTGTYPVGAVWGNGIPAASRSTLHFHGIIGMTWQNDGSSCAMAGKTENVSVESPTAGPTPSYSVVTDTTNKASIVLLNPGVY